MKKRVESEEAVSHLRKLEETVCKTRGKKKGWGVVNGTPLWSHCFYLKGTLSPLVFCWGVLGRGGVWPQLLKFTRFQITIIFTVLDYSFHTHIQEQEISWSSEWRFIIIYDLYKWFIQIQIGLKFMEERLSDKLFLISGQSKTETKSGLYFRWCFTFVVILRTGKRFYSNCLPDYSSKPWPWLARFTFGWTEAYMRVKKKIALGLGLPESQVRLLHGKVVSLLPRLPFSKHFKKDLVQWSRLWNDHLKNQHPQDLARHG